MREIQIDNIYIQIEIYDRFHNITRAYQLDDAGDIVAFLGKYIIGSRDIDTEWVINEYRKKVNE